MTDTTLTISEDKALIEAAAEGQRVCVDTVNRDEWNGILKQFDDATLFQTWDYEAVRWGEHCLSHVVIEEDGNPVAAAQVRVVRMPVLNCGIAYVYSGPLWRPLWRPLEDTEDVELFGRIVLSLRREYVEKRGLALRLVPGEIDGNNGRLHQALEGLGFRRLEKIKPYRSFLIDLEQPEESLLGNFRPRCRTRLRSAMKKNLELETGESDELFSEFVRVYRQMRQRKQFEEHIDVGDFQEVQSRLPDALKMRVVVCRYEGAPVAAAVCAALGRTGILLLLATSEAALKMNASLLTVWHGMVDMKSRGVRYFDVGGIDPEDNPGGYVFKSSFGGDEIFHLGTYETCDNRLSYVTTHAGERLRAAGRKAAALSSRLMAKPAPPTRPNEKEDEK